MRPQDVRDDRFDTQGRDLGGSRLGTHRSENLLAAVAD
jgi:hypothetical protein